MTAQPKINWGISTLGCHELNLEAIGQLAERHDIHTLEVRSLADCLNLPDYLDTTFGGDPGAAQTILDQYQQNIIALNSGFSLGTSNESAREELCGFVRWAERLSIPFIRIFGGGTMAESLSGEWLDCAINNLNWWQDLREKNEWTPRLALETHDGFSSGQRCLHLMEALGRPLDIIWDTHHTWKMGNETAEQTWEQISHLIRHVHIKDSISVPSARHPYTYVLPGDGEFPAIETLSLLKENNYRGVVSLEWERKWHPYLPTLDAALKALKTANWRTAPAAAVLT